MLIHNCHSHIFTFQAVPNDLLPLSLVRFLARNRLFKPLARLLNHLNPFSTDDLFDRYSAFISTGSKTSQEQIFKDLQHYYPSRSRFVVLSMDMEYMGAGAPDQPFVKQLEGLRLLKNSCKEVVLPFICIDPRRTNFEDLALEYLFDGDSGLFSGIKLYPPLGYYPYDSRLKPILGKAQERQVPIISHTSEGGVYYMGRKDNLIGYLRKDVGKHAPVDEVVRKLENSRKARGKTREEVCSFFCHPIQYMFLLRDFPRLKIDLAHFGGQGAWETYLQNPSAGSSQSEDANIVYEIKELLENGSGSQDDESRLSDRLRRAQQLNWFALILQMLRQYENVYADISFTLFDQRFFPLLKVLLQDQELSPKILFGSDYYMVQTATSERMFSLDLRGYLGEADYFQIAETNAKRFLNLG